MKSKTAWRFIWRVVLEQFRMPSNACNSKFHKARETAYFLLRPNLFLPFSSAELATLSCSSAESSFHFSPASFRAALCFSTAFFMAGVGLAPFLLTPLAACIYLSSSSRLWLRCPSPTYLSFISPCVIAPSGSTPSSLGDCLPVHASRNEGANW